MQLLVKNVNAKSLSNVTRYNCHCGNIIPIPEGRYLSFDEVNEIVLQLERKIQKLENTIDEYSEQAIETEMGYDM